MAGQSLSQVAATSHVSKTDFDSAFRKALIARLDPQVTAGKLTKDQETRMVDRAVSLADQLWDRGIGSFGAGPFGRPGRRGGTNPAPPGPGGQTTPGSPSPAASSSPGSSIQ